MTPTAHTLTWISRARSRLAEARVGLDAVGAALHEVEASLGLNGAPAAPPVTVTSAPARVVARTARPTGRACEQCGGFNTRNAGTCVVCLDCHFSGGCG